jgi:hypothetical protein
MALEDLTGPAKFLDALVIGNPVSNDDRREGDDHIRGIKNVLRNSFPNVNGAVTLTDEEMNALAVSNLGGALLKDNNLSDLPDKAAARVNLGVLDAQGRQVIAATADTAQTVSAPGAVIAKFLSTAAGPARAGVVFGSPGSTNLSAGILGQALSATSGLLYLQSVLAGALRDAVSIAPAGNVALNPPDAATTSGHYVGLLEGAEPGLWDGKWLRIGPAPENNAPALGFGVSSVDGARMVALQPGVGWLDAGFYAKTFRWLCSGSGVVGVSLPASGIPVLLGAGPAEGDNTKKMATTAFVHGSVVGGAGRSWQNVSGARALGANYVAPGYPIQVNVSVTLGIDEVCTFVVNGVTVTFIRTPNYEALGPQTVCVSAVVPAGATYNIGVTAGGVILTWAELR